MVYKKNNILFNNSDTQTTTSINQKLAGAPNPKTLIPPILTPHSHDLTYWKDNNLINHSSINTQNHTDTFLSGYELSVCENNDIKDYLDNNLENILEEYNYEGVTDSCHPISDIVNPLYKNTRIQAPIPITQNIIYPSPTVESYELPENFIQDYSELPDILSSDCTNHTELQNYNKNLFTQNIQPDIYYNSEIIEPINSMIGISYTKENNPVSISNYEDLTFTEHKKSEKNEINIPEKYGVTESSIYDPRFYGYGTSYRSYNDDNLGQTKFYYDDINSIRMPNYICRSNIDHIKYADTYGPLNEYNKDGNIHTKNIRELAHQTFLNNSLQQRSELQERLLSKRNKELVQLRKFPKSQRRI